MILTINGLVERDQIPHISNKNIEFCKVISLYEKLNKVELKEINEMLIFNLLLCFIKVLSFNKSDSIHITVMKL